MRPVPERESVGGASRWAACVIGSLMLGAIVAATAPPPAIDAAFQRFWDARTPQDAGKATKDIVGSSVSFADALIRFKRGRTYAPATKRGSVQLQRRFVTGEFHYELVVPETYDPSRSYQVRFQLHGGVMMRETGEPRGRGGRGAGGRGGPLEGAEQIYVLPTSWREAPWWGRAQLENLDAILDSVKRTYNVDENRVVLSGVSDGATGLYYVAMRETTPFASFLPLNGFILVLNNRDVGMAGALFPHNLTNKPFFVVNGGQDPLYPAGDVTPIMRSFAAGGLDVVYRPQPDAGHNTSWWPQLKDEIEDFVRAHPRTPHPARITWQTDDVTSRNRAHWLVIDRLGASKPADELPDINFMTTGEEQNFGVRSSGMRVTAVVPGSNAAAFGLLPEDVVVSINDRVLPQGLDLTGFLGIYDPGLPMHFVVSRGKTTADLRGTYEPVMRTRVSPIFATGVPSGRVDVTRQGNTVRAVTRGVAAFTLLLSPDVFDFSAPVTVVADGATVFSGTVKSSVETLLTWAARDNDRTMLYGAELHVTLPPSANTQRGR